jgi:hypothetical protein
MSVRAQPTQLAACWEAAASYFGVAEWWSLSWGAPQLSAMAAELRRGGVAPGAAAGDIHSPRGSARELGGAGGAVATLGELGSTVASLGASLASPLPLRSKWAACYGAAKEAGDILAAHLVRRDCGRRPVTLVAASIGARVVWQCLDALASMPKGEGAGLVQDVLLMAAPVTLNPARWDRASSVVSGHVVNAYVPGNAQLAMLYRIDHATSQGCCGLAPVPSARVRNYDATAHVVGDSGSYHFALPAVLEAVGFFTAP